MLLTAWQPPSGTLAPSHPPCQAPLMAPAAMVAACAVAEIAACAAAAPSPPPAAPPHAPPPPPPWQQPRPWPLVLHVPRRLPRLLRLCWPRWRGLLRAIAPPAAKHACGFAMLPPGQRIPQLPPRRHRSVVPRRLHPRCGDGHFLIGRLLPQALAPYPMPLLSCTRHEGWLRPGCHRLGCRPRPCAQTPLTRSPPPSRQPSCLLLRQQLDRRQAQPRLVPLIVGPAAPAASHDVPCTLAKVPSGH